MKFTKLKYVAYTLLAAAVLTTAQAEVVYTPVNVVIPSNGSYNVDLNRDGATDFTIRSSVGLVWCAQGDGGYWSLTATPAQNNAVAVTTGQNAAALPIGVDVDSTLGFYAGSTVMVHFAFGYCGSYILGNWFNLPYRYLGLRVQGQGPLDIHYGWAELSDVVYLDQRGNLHASTTLVGFAYETTPGKPIMTGQTSDESGAPADTPGSAGP